MREADRCVAEIENALPGWVRLKPLSEAGFKGNVALLQQAYPHVMAEACAIRRRRLVDNRARALELAFDFTLRKAVGDKWERSGEVYVDKRGGRVQALCVLSAERKENDE